MGSGKSRRGFILVFFKSYFYFPSSSRLKEENAHIRLTRHKGKDNEKDEAPSANATDPFSEDEGSVIRGFSKHNNSCGACRTRESECWWRAPKGLVTDILCDTCGTNWRKYADLNLRPVREDGLPPGKKGLEKREGTPLTGPNAKRLRVIQPNVLVEYFVQIFLSQASTSVNTTPPPNVPVAPQLRCLACQKNGPVGKVLRCSQCQFRVHAGEITDPVTLYTSSTANI